MVSSEIPIKSWETYFLKEEYTPYNSIVSDILAIRKEIQLDLHSLETIRTSGCYECTYQKYVEMDRPANLEVISCAVSERLYEFSGEILFIETRIVGAPVSSSFDVICTENVSKLISVIATVSTVGFHRIENRVIYFECKKCRKQIEHKIHNNIYTPPVCTCKCRSMTLLRNHRSNRCIDKQEIKIQETCAYGRAAASAEIELSGMLVGAVAPGDLVQLTGLVGTQLVNDAYRLKILCSNIVKIQSKAILSSIFTGEVGLAELPSNMTCEFAAFKSLAEMPDLMDLCVDLFFPTVIGHTSIKQAIVLSLFGGLRKSFGSLNVRGEIHLFIIGDPGLGKSKILLAASSILPKSTVVSGSSSTSAGLTVSVTHDPVSGEYMADAGALVLCNGGICCIDEFDKLDNVYALFEAMDSQTITVAKAGVVCSVASNSSVIAVSNPKFGTFDHNKSVSANLSFSSALLTRFDLVFLIKDDGKSLDDQQISKEILAGMRREDKKRQKGADMEMIRKYIEYARNTVQPILTKSAKQIIKEYYTKIRKEKRVSIRMLETIIRLSESIARMRLKSIASSTDAEYAIELYSKTFINGETSERKERRSIDEILREYVLLNGEFIKRERLMELIRKEIAGRMIKRDPESILEMLNSNGTILICKNGNYKINVR